MNKIPFAKSRKTGKMMSVFDVERGLACDCVCPECGALVEACKGEIRCFFRHEKNMQGSEACRNPFETSLHEMSKELIHDGLSMWLPGKKIDYLNQVDPIIYSEGGYYVIGRVESERWQDGIRPDLTVRIDGKTIYIEIVVTHRVDDDKLIKIAQRDVPTLAIDLSSYANEDSFTVEELKNLLLSKNGLKSWIYYDHESYELEQKLNNARRLFTRERDGEFLVNKCPIEYQTYKYGNEKSWENCETCLFCASINRSYDGSDSSITCTAELGFSLKDKTLDARSIVSHIYTEREKRKKSREERQKKKAALREANRTKKTENYQQVNIANPDDAPKKVDNIQINKEVNDEKRREWYSLVRESFEKGKPIVQHVIKMIPGGDMICPITNVRVKEGYDKLPKCRRCKYCVHFNYYKYKNVFESKCCYPRAVSDGMNVSHNIFRSDIRN